MTYDPRYGELRGLVDRLGEWAQRMKTDRSLPWAGTGIIKDIEAAMKHLNSREFLENLRVTGTGDEPQYATEALEALDTVEAAENAVYNADFDLGEGGSYTDPPKAIEILDKAATAATTENEAIRDILVEIGALGAQDNETSVPDLLRALLA